MTEEPRPGFAEAAVGTPGEDRPRLYFVQVPEGKAVKNRLHLDVMPSDRTQDEEIARLVGLGARVVSDPRPGVRLGADGRPGGQRVRRGDQRQ